MYGKYVGKVCMACSRDPVGSFSQGSFLSLVYFLGGFFFCTFSRMGNPAQTVTNEVAKPFFFFSEVVFSLWPAPALPPRFAFCLGPTVKLLLVKCRAVCFGLSPCLLQN